MTSKLAVLLGSLAITVGLAAPSAQGETLDEALAFTYETNPRIAAGRAGLRAIDEEVSQALSNWRPTVEVTGDYSVRRRDRDGPATGTGIGSGTDHPRSIGLGIRQNLFRGFRTEAESERARHRVAAGRADLFEREQQVLQRAVTAYMNVLRDRAILRLRENNVHVLEQQLQATRDRFEVGELTRTDVAQAESRLASSISDRTLAEGNLNSSIAAYNEVVGRQPGELNMPELPSAQLPGNEDDAVALAKVNNPQVIAADFTERAARSDVDLRAGQMLPTLTLDGAVERNRDTLGSNVTATQKQVRLNLSVPLYQSGAVYSQIRQAKQTASQRLSELSELQRRAEELTRDAWATLYSARARIESLNSEIRAQEVAYEGVQQEAQVGARTVLDVLDAEQELLNARVSLVQAERDTVVAAYQLLSAVGRLTAQDLGLPVAIYDPVRNYEEVEGKAFGSDILDER